MHEYFLPRYRQEAVSHSTPKTSIMKSTFTIGKIFSLCCFIVYIFSSCTKYLIVNGNVKVPEKVTISITGYNTGTGELTMVDDSMHSAVIFKAWPSQIITWKIKVSGIHEIDSITKKITNVNEIFSVQPHKVFLSKSWKGTVKDSVAIQNGGVKDLAGYFDYDYNIVWDSAGIKHTFDPRIQIR